MAKVSAKTMVKILTGRWGPGYDEKEKGYETPVILVEQEPKTKKARSSPTVCSGRALTTEEMRAMPEYAGMTYLMID